MKRISLVLITSAIVSTFLLCLPAITENAVTDVKTVRAGAIQRTEQYYITGKMSERSKKQIYQDIPIVASEVYADIGDRVNAGDIIATVDKSSTMAAISSLLEQVQLLPEEYKDVVSGAIESSAGLLSDGLLPDKITAEASGVITEMNLQSGVICSPTAPLAVISSAEDLIATFNIDEAYADKINVGDEVIFKANATGDIKYSAVIERINPAAKETISGTSQQTVVSFTAKPGEFTERLKAGYSINGVVIKDYSETMLILPYEAVLQDNDNNEYVYVVNGKVVKKTIVKTGEELIDGIEIVSGITEKDIIVKNASAIISDKSLVRIKN